MGAVANAYELMDSVDERPVNWARRCRRCWEGKAVGMKKDYVSRKKKKHDGSLLFYHY